MFTDMTVQFYMVFAMGGICYCVNGIFERIRKKSTIGIIQNTDIVMMVQFK